MSRNRWNRLQILVIAGMIAAGMSACGTTSAQTTETAQNVTEPTTEDAATLTTEDTSADEALAESKETEPDQGDLTSVRKRRTLPHGEASDVAKDMAQEPENPNAITEDYPASAAEIVRLDTYEGSTVSFKVLEDVHEDEIAAVDDSFPETQEDMVQMLEGLITYWGDEENAGNMESVDYLVRMEKYQYLSQMLEGTRDYYYVGEENADGEPDGLGLAVYADNAYYYGEFVDGERSGTGFWYQIFVQDGAYSKANNGIIGHSYNGTWENDLPNGSGQEHLDIDTAYLKDRVINNVRTDFADGYYNGEIVATSLETDEGMINWTGEARYGTMVVIDGEYVENDNGQNEVRVLQNVDNEDNYYWMLMDENCGQGITGLVD